MTCSWPYCVMVHVFAGTLYATPTCSCSSPLDPLLPRPCSVLLLCSGFRVVLEFWCGGFWFLLVCARLPVAASALWSSPGTLSLFWCLCLPCMCHVFVCVPRLELRRRCPFFIGFFLGSDPRPRRGCSSWLCWLRLCVGVVLRSGRFGLGLI